MKPAFLLLGWWVALGCSAAAPDEKPEGNAGSGGSSSGSSAQAGSGGAAQAGAGGAPSSSGGSSTSGANAVAGGGAGQAGSAAAVSGAAGAGGGAAGSGTCAANPSGPLTVVGETVHDPKTCLDWLKTTQTGVNYAAAETFCGDSVVGGFDDWRIPSASELASTVTLCGMYPPQGPIDTTVFDLQGDGYWTTTSAGEPNKVCAIGMLNAGGYYHYGTSGPQVVRCVRGEGTVQSVTDCTTAQGCHDW